MMEIECEVFIVAREVGDCCPSRLIDHQVHILTHRSPRWKTPKVLLPPWSGTAPRCSRDNRLSQMSWIDVLRSLITFRRLSLSFYLTRTVNAEMRKDAEGHIAKQPELLSDKYFILLHKQSFVSLLFPENLGRDGGGGRWCACVYVSLYCTVFLLGNTKFWPVH